MNQYYFGVSSTRISRAKAKRYVAAARAEGAEMTEVNIRECCPPGINGGRYQRWMECPNRGSPFDRETEFAVLARLAKIDSEVA